eukprot:3271624-Rhodomonas_salina.1
MRAAPPTERLRAAADDDVDEEVLAAGHRSLLSQSGINLTSSKQKVDLTLKREWSPWRHHQPRAPSDSQTRNSRIALFGREREWRKPEFLQNLPFQREEATGENDRCRSLSK